MLTKLSSKQHWLTEKSSWSKSKLKKKFDKNLDNVDVRKGGQVGAQPGAEVEVEPEIISTVTIYS